MTTSTQTKTIEKVSNDQQLGCKFMRYFTTPSETVITEITPNSPSAIAGLKVGDKIISLDGVSTESSSVRKIWQACDAGSVEIVIARGSANSKNTDVSVIKAVLNRASAEEDFGLHLVQSSEPNKVIVGHLKGPASISNFQPGDFIVSINGSKVTNVEEGQVLLEQFDATELNITVYRNKSFKKLVEKEFSREFSIIWRDSNVCKIDRKDNPDTITAWCCPGCVHKISFTLSLGSGGQIQWVDNISRMQASLAAGAGNASQMVGVQGHNNRLVQSLSRIESQLVGDATYFELAVAATTTAPLAQAMVIESQLVGEATGSELAVAATTPAPLAQGMVRMDDDEDKPSVSDEIAKLKALLDDGTLSEEEFQQAKKKVLLS